MASPQQIKQYLAVWFQLGKRVAIANGQSSLCPVRVYEGDRYSEEFEKVWQQILRVPATTYLEGTHQTIRDLLSPAWEISSCARCGLFVPIGHAGVFEPGICPCHDLPSWPNTELPLPRPPVDSANYLGRICDRLQSSRAVECESKN
jgi:hypothetical protein